MRKRMKNGGSQDSTDRCNTLTLFLKLGIFMIWIRAYESSQENEIYSNLP